MVQPQIQTWIKEADKKNAKMQDICSKETKMTAASLLTAVYNSYGKVLICSLKYYSYIFFIWNTQPS